MLAPIFSESDPELLYQYINITTMNGIVSYNIQELDSFQKRRMILAVLFGVRAGTSAVVSIILFLLSARRDTPVYIFNQVSLILFFIHSTLFLVNTFSPFGALSTVFTYSYASVTAANVNVSVATSVFQLCFVIAIQCSLFFQGRIVFPKKSKARFLVSILLGFMSLATIIIYTLYIVSSCRAAVNPVGPTLFGEKFGTQLPSIAQIMFATSISVCMLIFVGKLIFAIRTRRVLGLKQFGPLQIICIMGAQSMIGPAVMTVISFARPDLQNVYSLAGLIVVISLPLSAMWASSANTTPSPTSTTNFNSHAIYRHMGGFSEGGSNGFDPSEDYSRNEKQHPESDATERATQAKRGLYEKCKHAICSLFDSSETSAEALASRRNRDIPSPINVNWGTGTRHLASPQSSLAGQYMSRNSFEAQANCQDKYQMSTRVSISKIDSNLMSSSDEYEYVHLKGSPGEQYGEMQGGGKIIEYVRSPDTPSTNNISPLGGTSKGMGIIMGSEDDVLPLAESQRGQHLV